MAAVAVVFGFLLLDMIFEPILGARFDPALSAFR
ncbi:hypothetical protein ACVIJ6_002080 [Bradyrhizobium sp. USDA 4369]